MTITPLKSKNNTRFFINFRLMLKSNKKMLTVISVLHLLGLPLLATVLVTSINADWDTDVSVAMFVIIAIFCLCAAIICGIIIAVNNFSYLYKKSQVDMVNSLPIKRKYKFLSDFFSGLAVYIVPYIIASIVANLILICGKICVPDLAESMRDGTMMSLILQGEFAGLLMMIMLYTLSVLVISCCGTLFESIMNIFMINALIPGAIAVIAAMLFSNLYGVPIYSTVAPMLGYTSPLGAVIYMFTMLENSGVLYTYTDFVNIDAGVYGKWVLLFVIFTAIYFFISMFLYQKRKSEDVSKPYVYKILYYILITVITMAISLIARYEISMIFPVIIFSLIVYMIFEVITNRGFKKIYKSFIRYVATMVGILIICVAATGTRGFGVEAKTFSASRLNSVEVNYSGIDAAMEWGESEYYSSIIYIENYIENFMGEGNTIKYKDKNIIEAIVNLQKQVLESYQNGDVKIYNSNNNIFSDTYYSDYYEDCDDYPVYGITFKFNQKTGGTTTRKYQLTFEQLEQLFILDDTEEMAEYKAKDLEDSITVINWTNRNERVYSYSLEYSLLKNEYSNTTQISLKKEEAKEFTEAYKLDYMESTIEEFTTSKPLCYINTYTPVRESFKRTVDFLKTHGGLQESDMPTMEGTLYPPEGFKSWGRSDVTATFGYAEKMDSLSHWLTNAQTQELFKYANSHYYAQEDCYVMEIDGIYYAIPAEYSEIAEKIYIESNANINQYTFEEFMDDISDLSDPEEYINNYLNYDYAYYDDISKAFNMRYTYDYDSDMGTNYKRELQIYEEYDLLKMFFNFTSLDEYKMFADENEIYYNPDIIIKMWEDYTISFPMLSQKVIGR